MARRQTKSVGISPGSGEFHSTAAVDKDPLLGPKAPKSTAGQEQEARRKRRQENLATEPAGKMAVEKKDGAEVEEESQESEEGKHGDGAGHEEERRSVPPAVESGTYVGAHSYS